MKQTLINRFFTYTLTVFIMVFGFITCQDLVDVRPQGQISDKDVFSTASSIEAAMNGAYNYAQNGYPFGSAAIQSDFRGEDMLDLSFYVTYTASYSPTTSTNVYMWNALYALVNHANIVYDGVKASTVLSAAKKNQYLGECLFLRSLAHHELLTSCSRPYNDNPEKNPGIFYRDFGINSEASIAKAGTVGRSTVADVYKKVLADLDSAENWLPVGSASDPYRASKAAAIALKMRLKMHKGDWKGVIEEGSKLITDGAVTSPSKIGTYSLASIDALFGTSALPPSSESIFYLRHSNTDNTGLASLYQSRGIGYAAVSPIIYTDPLWLATDLRKTKLVVDGTGSNSRYKYLDKYKDVATGTDATPIIRYSEVLLMVAEAACRKSKTVSARALQLLNAVRNRAVTTAADQYTTASFTDYKDMLNAILTERRIEFLGEGLRWADIHRTAKDTDVNSYEGIPSKMTSTDVVAATYTSDNSSLKRGVLAIPYDDRRFIWPIPLDEVQQNPNKNIQNPGY